MAFTGKYVIYIQCDKMCYVVVRPSVAPMTTVSTSWRMGLTWTVGAEVAGWADPRTKYL